MKTKKPKTVTKPDIKKAVKRAPKPKLPDITEHVEVVIKRYVIVDQTPIMQVVNADSFLIDKEDITNYRNIELHTHFILVYNDLAEALIAKGEQVLKNEWGTWWLVDITEKKPLNKNKALIEITREAMEKEKNDGK